MHLTLSSDLLTFGPLRGQVMQDAERSNWAKGQGLSKLKIAHWKLNLFWDLRTEGQDRRRKSCWGHLLSGLSLWMAMGE